MATVNSKTPNSPVKPSNPLTDVPGDSSASAVPPPAYSPHPTYQATYQPAPYHAEGPAVGAIQHDLQPESAGKRFFKAFAIALVIWVILGGFTESAVELGNAHGRPPYRHHAVLPKMPVPDDNPAQCLSGFGSLKDGGLTSSRVLFQLPVSAERLVVSAQGALATGDIYLVQSSDPAQTSVNIYVDVFSDAAQEALSSVNVCQLQREPMETGVTIYTSDQWPGWDAHVRFNVTVLFPISHDGSPLFIPYFDTSLERFTHHVGDLYGKVDFKTLNLRSGNAPISAESLGADVLSVTTSEDEITGTYHSWSYLSLITSNAKIMATTFLYHAGDRTSSTRLDMATSNNLLTAHVHLISSAEPAVGGLFTVDAKTSNGVLDVDVPAIPLNALLNLNAETSNAVARMTLERQFEGTFELHTSNARGTVDYNHRAEDPAGRSRRREVVLNQSSAMVHGSVGWDDMKGRGKGLVYLKSSNAPITLNLP